MNIPVNCISCGTQIYASTPIEELKCEKCKENECYKNALYALLYMANDGELVLKI